MWCSSPAVGEGCSIGRFKLCHMAVCWGKVGLCCQARSSDRLVASVRRGFHADNFWIDWDFVRNQRVRVELNNYSMGLGFEWAISHNLVLSSNWVLAGHQSHRLILCAHIAAPIRMAELSTNSNGRAGFRLLIQRWTGDVAVDSEMLWVLDDPLPHGQFRSWSALRITTQYLGSWPHARQCFKQPSNHSPDPMKNSEMLTASDSRLP